MVRHVPDHISCSSVPHRHHLCSFAHLLGLSGENLNTTSCSIGRTDRRSSASPSYASEKPTQLGLSFESAGFDIGCPDGDIPALSSTKL